MRVVLDSNIWISALEFGGVPREVVHLADEQDEILFCHQIGDEVARILTTSFSRALDKTHRRIAELTEGATRIVITGKFAGICRDPQDDYLLECAVIGKADAIVTGDKDLLSLREYAGVRMLTPRQYLDEARSR